MAETITTSQIPQHVAAQLAHLTSRPSVQSTLILSRKDGSIIQVTGQLDSQSNSTRNSESSAREPETLSSIEDAPSGPVTEEDTMKASSPDPTPSAPYKPSQVEALAAHIYAFVSSASSLSIVLSSPATSGKGQGTDFDARISQNGVHGSSSTAERDAPDKRDGNDRDDEDEVKLLRLRTRIHEIIIIPDRRFLLCVVHDVSATGGGGSSRR